LHDFDAALHICVLPSTLSTRTIRGPLDQPNRLNPFLGVKKVEARINIAKHVVPSSPSITDCLPIMSRTDQWIKQREGEVRQEQQEKRA
jgi:hypothetical protein